LQQVDITPAVWRRLLEVRAGDACVCCGAWSAPERAALDLYGPLARRDSRPTITGQIGQSLDGRIATAGGEARDVSGPDGLNHLHRLRALAEGVVIGVRTALHDAPRLTVRRCEGPNPARIVIDPRGRLPDDSPVLIPDGARRIVIQAVNTKRAAGVEVIRMEAGSGQFAPELIVEALREAGLFYLLIEGGSYTIAKFIEAGLLDRLHVAVSPLLIGGGPSGLTLFQQPETLADALRPDTRVFSLGSDIVFDCGFSSRSSEAIRPVHDTAI